MRKLLSSLVGSAKFSFLKVTFFAAFVLLLETVLFHVLNYIYDYFAATMVISFAILGIGLGAFLASRINIKEEALFSLCCIGTTLCVYIAVAAVMFSYPLFWISAASIPLSFLFPVVYIATIFRNHRASPVYMYDMVGAFLGVLITVLLYKFLHSESIILLLTLVIPFVGLIVQLFSGKPAKRFIFLILFILLIIPSGFFFYKQLAHDSFNVFRIISRQPFNPDQPKIFNYFSSDKLAKSYDSLLGRIDVVHSKIKKSFVVAWNGFDNDHFNDRDKGDYDTYFGPRDIEWPHQDIRILYGVVDEPKVFIIGSAAQGITKSVKTMTPLRNIYAVEINPSIIEIMTKDFYEESGQAYKGLRPILGNALALLKSTDEKFDIITLINTHSTKNIAYQGPPDYLHTIEHYNLYFDHLTDKGYLLFEERPVRRIGELGLYRMIHTIWQSLKQRGEDNPKLHFVIWEWMGRGKTKIKKNHDAYYVSMIVTKKPIIGELREKIIQWIRNCAQQSSYYKRNGLRISYLNGFRERQEFVQLFNMIESADFKPLEEENFGPGIVTSQRPFLQIATKSYPRLKKLVINTGLLTMILWGLFTLGLVKVEKKKQGWLLNIYNVLLGGAYFFIEIMLLQVYQHIFIAASSTLILVLGLLLLSSGVGGYFSERLDVSIVTFLLIPISLSAVYAPTFLFNVGIPFIWIKFVSIFLICAAGFFMGVYFPKGLAQAKAYGLQQKIPHLFAINSVGGSFAVIFALFLGIKIGYQMTVLFAIVFYILASAILKILQPQKSI